MPEAASRDRYPSGAMYAVHSSITRNFDFEAAEGVSDVASMFESALRRPTA